MLIIKNKLIVAEKLDCEKAFELDILLTSMINRYHNIELDFNNCTYIDSKGLGVLVSALKKINNTGGKMKIEGISGNIKKLFVLTKLDKVFNIL